MMSAAFANSTSLASSRNSAMAVMCVWSVDLFQTAFHDQSLVFTNVGFGKRDLALKVGLVDGIGIGNRQSADTGGGKIRQGRRTQPAATDNEHMGSQEFFLASIPISSSKIWRLNRKSC